jgi:hypothetical protein
MVAWSFAKFHLEVTVIHCIFGIKRTEKKRTVTSNITPKQRDAIEELVGGDLALDAANPFALQLQDRIRTVWCHMSR